jgi:hypothetical protein
MIHAIYKDGQIQPVDAIPEDWEDGKELIVNPSSPSDDPEDIRRWSEDMRAHREKISDEDHAAFMAALAEQKRIGKEMMRKEMGL